MSADPFRQSPLGPTIHKATLEVYKAVFRIRMDPGFLPIRIRVLKVRIRIRPLINLWDLNDGFDKVLEKGFGGA